MSLDDELWHWLMGVRHSEARRGIEKMRVRTYQLGMDHLELPGRHPRATNTELLWGAPYIYSPEGRRTFGIPVVFLTPRRSRANGN